MLQHVIQHVQHVRKSVESMRNDKTKEIMQLRLWRIFSAWHVLAWHPMPCNQLPYSSYNLGQMQKEKQQKTLLPVFFLGWPKQHHLHTFIIQEKNIPLWPCSMVFVCNIFGTNSSVSLTTNHCGAKRTELSWENAVFKKYYANLCSIFNMKNEWKNIPDPIVKKCCLLKSSFQGCVLFDFDVPSKILQITKGYEFGCFLKRKICWYLRCGAPSRQSFLHKT